MEVLDAAYWMKGCSSLGRLRFAVLLGVGKNYRKKGGLCLIDIKEAVPAAAPHQPSAPMPRDHGMRVVEGARQLSPALGERMLAARFLNRGVFMRELLPEDLKLEIDEIGREEAMKAAWYLAMVVGKAHARQMQAPNPYQMARRAQPQQTDRFRGPQLAVVEHRRARRQPRGGVPGALPEICQRPRPRRLMAAMRSPWP